MKIAKIIPCYPFVTNRGLSNSASNNPQTYEDWQTLISKTINVEQNTDFGVDIDLILYYRSEIGSDLGRDFLFKNNNKKTKNGKIFVYESPNDGKSKWGFSIIPQFINNHSDGYDYFIFQEDDIVILPEAKNYLIETIELLKTYKIVAYTLFINKNEKPHIGGTFGIYPVSEIKNNIVNFPYVPTNHEVDSSQFMFSSCGALTNNYESLNKIVGKLSSYSNYPKNYNLVKLYTSARNMSYWNICDKYLFTIGTSSDDSVVSNDDTINYVNQHMKLNNVQTSPMRKYTN